MRKAHNNSDIICQLNVYRIAKAIACFLASSFLFVTTCLSQEIESDTAEAKPIIVINADRTKGFDKGARSILSGNVILRQDSTVIYASKVNLKSADNAAEAFGDVTIQRSDTTNAYCDELRYNGQTEYAKMDGNVVLENGAQKLYADKIEYDMKNNIAYYNNQEALMTDGERLITSKFGTYFIDSSLVIFYDSVVVAGPDYTMRTDSLHFNPTTKVATFVAPVRMKQLDNNIYCESGYYDLQNNFASLQNNAQYASPEKEAVADTILFYGNTQDFTLIGNTWVKEKDKEATADRIEYQKSKDKVLLIGNVDYKDAEQTATGERMEYTLSNGAFKTEGRALVVQGSQKLEADHMQELAGQDMVRASGNVIYFDSAQNVTLFCADALIDKVDNEVKAFGKGLRLITQMEGDSLHVTADTLVSTQVTDSNGVESRQLYAYHNVVGYKKNLQFVADSLRFNEQDSMFRIFGDPVIWSDTSRFFGDTINVQMANDAIKEIEIIDNAFVINKSNSGLFNQVKGRRIIATFFEQELQHTYVKGNAQSIYYAADDSGAYIGVNKIDCSEMKLSFQENEVAEIRFYKKPTSVFHPMEQVDHNTLKLEGFSYDETLRSTSPTDIFRVYELISKKEIR